MMDSIENAIFSIINEWWEINSNYSDDFGNAFLRRWSSYVTSSTFEFFINFV